MSDTQVSCSTRQVACAIEQLLSESLWWYPVVLTGFLQTRNANQSLRCSSVMLWIFLVFDHIVTQLLFTEGEVDLHWSNSSTCVNLQYTSWLEWLDIKECLRFLFCNHHIDVLNNLKCAMIWIIFVVSAKTTGPTILVGSLNWNENKPWMFDPADCENSLWVYNVFHV